MEINDFRKMVWDLFPLGLAWTRQHGILDHIVLGIAQELTQADMRKEQLILEMDPRTASEMFSDWETEWGLPDECTNSPAQTWKL